MVAFSRSALLVTAPLASTALLADTASAHGGEYRGPGDVVPPGSGRGPGTPSAPGPRGPGSVPTTPGGVPGAAPAGPATGRPGIPGSRTPGVRTGGPGLPDPDFTQWTFWWQFNKDPFLRLKDAIHGTDVVTGGDVFWLGQGRRSEGRSLLRPTRNDTVFEILPVLKKAIDSTDQNDITSACMVAMAKIGEDHPEFALRDVFVQRLARRQQEVREVAALSLGIAAQQRPEVLDLLIAIATDAPAGRKACDHLEVDDRTRSFAAYGLGLLVHAHADVAWKRLAFAALRSLVEDEAISSRNLKVAAIESIGLLAVDASLPEGKVLLGEALQCLEDCFKRTVGPGEQLIQAHCPTAIARLLAASRCEGALVERYEQLFAAELTRQDDARRSHDLARSCVLALGQLCSPVDDAASPDAAHCERLMRTFRDHKDAQTRAFAILALGQIGGAHNRSRLLQAWPKAGDSLEKPWLALAMGCMDFERRAVDAAAQQAATRDRELGRCKHEALAEIKDPQAVAALALGLGLVQHVEAQDDLRALLHEHRHKDELAGYLCIGLSLMDDRRSCDDIRSVLRTSLRRPLLLRQAAIALGKLGDKTVADELLGLLDQREPNLSTLSAVPSAIGFIGDRRSIAPLRAMLHDDSLTPLPRAFAAVALGGFGDKERLPWNSKIGANTNYRAAVETLTDGRAGILDIL